VAQDIAMTIQLNTQDNVDRYVFNLPIPPMESIQVNDGIDSRQWPILPSLYQRPYLIGNRADGC
jgi:hypothetical protein